MNLKKYIPNTTEAVKILVVVVVASAIGITGYLVRKTKKIAGRA